MSYDPVGWDASTPLDAANLGTMDDGIDDAHDRVDGVEGDLDSHKGPPEHVSTQVSIGNQPQNFPSGVTVTHTTGGGPWGGSVQATVTTFRGPTVAVAVQYAIAHITSGSDPVRMYARTSISASSWSPWGRVDSQPV